MAVNKRRLLIVVVVGMVVTIVGGGVYALRFKKSQQASALAASAKRYLEAGQYDSARIELDKLLLLQPRHAEAHWLRGRALLQTREPHRIAASDRQGLEAMRCFIQATRLNPDLIEAHRMLVAFFVAAPELTDLAEASNHAKAVLRLDPDDLNAHYAQAAYFVTNKQLQDALTHVEVLLAQEKPLRPRSAWLAARLSDLMGKDSTLPRRIPSFSSAAADVAASSVQDRLALVELSAWQARRENDPARARDRLTAAIEGLKKLLAEEGLGGAAPRAVVQAAYRILPSTEQQPTNLQALYQEFRPVVAELTDQVFRRAIEAKTYDPSIYLEFAGKLRDREKLAEAVQVVEQGIANAKAASPEVRRVFSVCDLWLAEHYLGNREPEKSQPYIEALLADEGSRVWGELLAGFRLIQEADWEAASKRLLVAVTKMPEHGVANVLYGLCQLKRGYVSEGRQYLEKGIRLGASEPRYKAWLAAALADAGYQNQAMTMARQALSDRATSGLGRALLGQLHLRAGDYEAAAADLQSAYEAAEPSVKPTLRLLQAELAIYKGDGAGARKILADLQQIPMVAPRAYALDYRYLRGQKQDDEAFRLLADGRAKYPNDPALLGYDVSRLVETRRFDLAHELLEQQMRSSPKSPTPHLLLAEVHEAAKNTEKAVEVLTRATQRLPEESALKVRLVEKLLKVRRFDEAGKVLADLKADPTANPSTIDALLAQAASLRGDLAKAEEIIEKRYSVDPDNPEIKFLRGKLAARKGDYATAAELFEQTLSSGAFQANSVQSLFDSLLRQGETQRAVELLGKAEKKGQPVALLRERLLRLLARQEEWGLLDRELNALLQAAPSEENTALAVSLLRYMGQPVRAHQILDKGLERFPQSAILKEHKVALLFANKDLAGAEKLLAASLAEAPQNPTFHVLKTYLMLESDRTAEAEKAAQDGWRACPGNPALAALCVQTALRQKKAQEALDFATNAYREHPSLPRPYYMLARVYEAMGDRPTAIAMLEKTLAEDPTDGTAAHHFLRMRIAEGRTADLKPIVERLLAANPSNSLLLGVLIEYYAGRGEVAKAQELLANLERSDASGVLLPYSRAVVATAKRDFATAERQLKTAMADPRGHLPSHYLLARVYAAQNKLEAALDVVHQALRQQPQSPTALWMRADFLSRLGRLQEAEAACRDYLRNDPKARNFRVLQAQVLEKLGGAERLAASVKLADQLLAEGLDQPLDVEICVAILLKSGDKERVRQLVTEKGFGSDQPELRLAAGRAFLVAGDPRTALHLARQALASPMPPVSAKLLLADATAQIAREDRDNAGLEKAADLYREALKQSPGHIVAANNLAWVVGVHLQKPHRAMEELSQALPDLKVPTPEMPADLVDTIGTLHLLMDHLSEAQVFLEAAAARNPEGVSTQFYLGQLYLKQRRADRAASCFRQVVALAPNSEWAARIRQEKLAN